MAEKTTAQLLAAHPEDAAAHEQHAWALLAQGEAEPAETHFRESLRLAPSSEQAVKGLREARRIRRWWRRCFHSRPRSRAERILFPILQSAFAYAAVLGVLVAGWILVYLAAVIWSAV